MKELIESLRNLIALIVASYLGIVLIGAFVVARSPVWNVFDWDESQRFGYVLTVFIAFFIGEIKASMK